MPKKGFKALTLRTSVLGKLEKIAEKVNENLPIKDQKSLPQVVEILADKKLEQLEETR